jgi:hypothetical protein
LHFRDAGPGPAPYLTSGLGNAAREKQLWQGKFC